MTPGLWPLEEEREGATIKKARQVKRHSAMLRQCHFTTERAVRKAGWQAGTDTHTSSTFLHPAIIFIRFHLLDLVSWLWLPTRVSNFVQHMRSKYLGNQG